MTVTINRVFACTLASGLSFNTAYTVCKGMCSTFDIQIAQRIHDTKNSLDIEEKQAQESDDDIDSERAFDTRCEYLELLEEGEIIPNAEIIK